MGGILRDWGDTTSQNKHDARLVLYVYRRRQKCPLPTGNVSASFMPHSHNRRDSTSFRTMTHKLWSGLIQLIVEMCFALFQVE